MTGPATPCPPAARLALTGRVVAPDGVLEHGVVVVEGDRVLWAGVAAEVPGPLRGGRVPAGWVPGRTILPGLVDTHCHGGAGGEFGPYAEGARKAVEHHHRSGSTSVVGSLVSNTPARLLAGVATCAGLVRDGQLAGVHLEGPFLSIARRGAQNRDVLTDVDPALLGALVEAAAEAGAERAIVQMTYAPERPGGAGLPRLLAHQSIVPAVGHTDSDVDTARAALRLGREVAPRGGRPLVTHVFNAMPPLHHRDPGPVAACLERGAAGDAVLEVVGDGVHLDAGTVRMLFEVVGAQGLDLVTDAMAATGMADGPSSLGGQDVLVSAGTARLAEGGSLAGGVSTLLDVVRWCVEEAGVSLADAVTAAATTPSRTLGLDDVGRLAPGTFADLVVVDGDLRPLSVMRRGAWL
ncbi:amidohydrolase family protein [Dermatophilaceae bacterium Soc4.6]